MNFRRDSNQDELKMDAALEQTLKDFRSSVHAWSESANSRPHKLVKIYTTSWRVVAGWALGCVLAAGSLTGGLYKHHQIKEQARIAAAGEAAGQQTPAAERRDESEDLLAKVDSDVSREVPSAMEPLAQLMFEDDSQ
jgi:hypothetical protein